MLAHRYCPFYFLNCSFLIFIATCLVKGKMLCLLFLGSSVYLSYISPVLYMNNIMLMTYFDYWFYSSLVILFASDCDSYGLSIFICIFAYSLWPKVTEIVLYETHV